MVYDRYLPMRQSPKRLKAEKVWEKGREQWEALRKDRGPEDWQSNHYVPTTAAVIETAISEIIDQSRKTMILPRGHVDLARAQVMEQIFSYSWEVSYSDLAEEDILRDALTCGTGIGQEYYFKDIRMIKTKPKGDKGKYEEERINCQANEHHCPNLVYFFYPIIRVVKEPKINTKKMKVC